MPFVPQTSDSHPLRLAAAVPPSGEHEGWAAVTLCPGKRCTGWSADHERDLDADLTRLVELGATGLVPLITDEELVELQVPGLVARAAAHGLTIRRFPIEDGRTPSDPLAFRSFVTRLADAVRAGEHLVIHCRGGLGRAGTVASCLRLALGLSPDAEAAIAAVRGVRPGAVENARQERFVRDFAAERQAPAT
jgi:protein-tyrosine phosphatase